VSSFVTCQDWIVTASVSDLCAGRLDRFLLPVALYGAVVAIMWLVPDRRIERVAAQ
jgi:hypothetical protein